MVHEKIKFHLFLLKIASLVADVPAAGIKLINHLCLNQGAYSFDESTEIEPG